MKRLFLACIVVAFFCSCNKYKNHTNKTIINPFYDKAFEYRELGKTDSAFLYFNKAKEVFMLNKEGFGEGKCLINMGIIATDKADYFSGQELSLNALNYLDTENKDHWPHLKSNYNNLGISAYHLQNYNKAIYFYEQSLRFNTDSAANMVIKNNIANVLRKQKTYSAALQIYTDILNKKLNDKEFARVSSNYAFTKWLQNPNYVAEPLLLKALATRININDIAGQNASYLHLTNYYIKMKPSMAYPNALKMLHTAQLLNNADDKIEALQILIKLSNESQSKIYFERYQQINDSLQTARNIAKNQFALIRYETEKHKADNLALQKQNTEKTYQVIIITSLSLLILIFGLFWYKKRQQHIKLIAEKAIKENQLKTSKKVHDVVANGLYRVMIEIENEKELDKERVLDKIEDMYEKSRDISYDNETFNLNNFQETLNNLIHSFKSSSIDIKIKGNTKALWQKVNAKVQHEITHILQELLVNMAKHSHATQASFTFEQSNKDICICYRDNGVGLANGVKFKNGLTNTGNRINHISGNITFETLTESGLEINISFPIS